MGNTEDRERWQRIKSVLALALELPPAQRTEFLNQSCGPDLDLRREVESLLGFELAEKTRTNSDEASKQEVGFSPSLERIGAYKTIREIGSGGMGTVYLAERADEVYHKKAAIKVIRTEGAGSESILQRFRKERQILASLEHPNIARLIDGGSTESGLPYLVMEYVEGLPIHAYCEKNHLNTEERIKIFRQLCSAVQYAHQHLIIHRDIKPSNILVTEEGVPKLLDFGIARLLGEEVATTDHPAPPTRIMTPEYASPEQIKGHVITTTTDVYSLGVVLYELLTGRSPYRSTSGAILEIMREVCETQPDKPSNAVRRTDTATTAEAKRHTNEVRSERLKRKLTGDIDNIILKALNKEPERRYQSAEQLSEDLRRHLEGLPVLARQLTIWYRSRKFIRRHKSAVLVTAVAVIALIAGLLEINRQRLRAEKRFNDVRTLANSFVFEYHDAIADLPGATPVRQRLVKDALAYLDSLARESSEDQSLQRELASAYARIGDVQGNSNMANLGDLKGALSSYRKSFELRKILLSHDSQDQTLQRELAESYLRIGDVLANEGDVTPAYENYQYAMTMLEALAKKFPDDPLLLRVQGEAYSGAGDVKGNPYRPNLGDLTAGLKLHRKALATFMKAAALKTGDREIEAEVLEEHRTIAGLLTSSGDLIEAERHARQAVAMGNELAKTEHSTRAVKALGNAREVLARVFLTREQWDDALVVYKEITVADEAMVNADPKDMQALAYLGTDYSQIGHILNNQKKFTKAIEYYRKALVIDQKISAIDPTNDVARYGLSMDYLSIGDALTQTGDLGGALKNQQEAVQIQEELVEENKNDMQAALNLAYARDRVSQTLAMLGNHKEAILGFRAGVATGEKALKQDPQNQRARRQLALRYLNLGDSNVSIASAKNMSNQDRWQYWRDGREAFQRSLELLNELNKNGILPSQYAQDLQSIPKKIAQCDVALRINQ